MSKEESELIFWVKIESGYVLPEGPFFLATAEEKGYKYIRQGIMVTQEMINQSLKEGLLETRFLKPGIYSVNSVFWEESKEDGDRNKLIEETENVISFKKPTDLESPTEEGRKAAKV